jgi:hypothetical protein
MRKAMEELMKMGQFRVGFFLLQPNTWFGGGQIALLRVAGWLAGKGLPAEIIVSRVEGKLQWQSPLSSGWRSISDKTQIKSLSPPDGLMVG